MIKPYNKYGVMNVPVPETNGPKSLLEHKVDGCALILNSVYDHFACTANRAHSEERVVSASFLKLWASVAEWLEEFDGHES